MPAGMIHAEQLIYEYDKRDDEGNVIGFERAIDGIDIDIPQGSFVSSGPSTGLILIFPRALLWPSSDITDRGNQPLPST